MTGADVNVKYFSHLFGKDIYSTRGFCPSCRAKRLEEWGEWMREKLVLDVPHRQVVFVIPKMLRIFFKYKRQLLGSLSQRRRKENSYPFTISVFSFKKRERR